MTEAVTTTHSLRATAGAWWNFVRRPYLPSADLRGFSRANLAGTGRVFVVNLLLNIGLVFVLGTIASGVEDAPEPTEITKVMADDPWPVVALVIGLVVPLVEELVFRSWLSGLVDHPPRWFRRAFPAICWIQALIFSSIHVSNYGETNSPLVLMFVVPQLVSGLSFSYARVRFGWWAAALLHIAHNSSVLTIAMIGTSLELGG